MCTEIFIYVKLNTYLRVERRVFQRSVFGLWSFLRVRNYLVTRKVLSVFKHMDCDTYLVTRGALVPEFNCYIKKWIHVGCVVKFYLGLLLLSLHLMVSHISIKIKCIKGIHGWWSYCNRLIGVWITKCRLIKFKLCKLIELISKWWSYSNRLIESIAVCSRLINSRLYKQFTLSSYPA